MKLGYSVNNYSLEKFNILTNRSFPNRSFPINQINKNLISNIIISNLNDLTEIMEWNRHNKIEMYRISNTIFPNIDISSFYEYPKFNEIAKLCIDIGNFARLHNIRLSTHADPRVVLVTPKLYNVKYAAKTLERYAYIFKLMGFEPSPSTKINMHIGGAYENKEKTKLIFIRNFNKYVPHNIKKFITIENDDRTALYTTEDLVEISKQTKIPIVFDYHHYRINPGNLSEQDALQTAINTWPRNITPVVHYSDEKKIYEDSTTKNIRTHADYIYNKPNTYGHDVDIMLESHAGDLSLLKYRNLT